ncbi:MAG: hypothetical protein MPK09_03195 [Gammaproteobacteria bacterium]|nr:hypothetical protein [Gammaproteobacteria bacterium]
MKLQYLGDAKDAFKWDYLSFLAEKVGARSLHYISMLAPEEEKKQGNASPRSFPALNNETTKTCVCWQQMRRANEKKMIDDFYKGLRRLLRHHGCDFLHVHKLIGGTADIAQAKGQLVFVDPDTGFEPKTAGKEHVRYDDIETIWPFGNDTNDTIVVVFQNAKRLKGGFGIHYKEIRKKLDSKCSDSHSTALSWNQVMFVALAKSSARIQKVQKANIDYKRRVECGAKRKIITLHPDKN